jgi:hypothetical protein
MLGKALALHGKYVYIHVVYATGARTPKLLKIYPEKSMPDRDTARGIKRRGSGHH